MDIFYFCGLIFSKLPPIRQSSIPLPSPASSTYIRITSLVFKPSHGFNSKSLILNLHHSFLCGEERRKEEGVGGGGVFLFICLLSEVEQHHGVRRRGKSPLANFVCFFTGLYSRGLQCFKLNGNHTENDRYWQKITFYFLQNV